MHRKLFTDRAYQFRDWHLPLHYQIVDYLGKGSYGEVVEARHKLTGQKVAIKRMTQVFDEPTDCKRILRELTILKATRGVKGLVNLIDIYYSDDLHTFNDVYCVLEFAPCDLKKLIGQKRLLSMAQVRRLMINLLEALHDMHSLGLVHRDLKPANVLVFEDLTIKICDFGLSRSLINLKKTSEDIMTNVKKPDSTFVTPPQVKKRQVD